MKRRRIKPAKGEAVYHCMSRLVCGVAYWDERTKEMMRRQLWRCADFSGVRILTYCLMDNHFHVLIQVPDRGGVLVSDEELVRRYRCLYPEPTTWERLRIEAIEAILREQGTRAEAIRRRLLARMHDVSEFMKTFKQRFSVWFNRTHERHGTLWSERFQSVLVENDPNARRTVAAYIDLNPVRAGLVNDPKDYRWCGYAEALGGNANAREGIALTVGAVDPNISPENAYFGPSRLADALDFYRMLLFGEGLSVPKGKDSAVRVNLEEVRRVMKAGGKLPLHVLLRCRVRYFTYGLVLGSRTFVQQHLEDRIHRGELRRKRSPSGIITHEVGELAAVRGTL